MTLNEMNHHYLVGGIDDDSVKPAIDWILSKNSLNVDERPKFLSLIINSPGGEIDAAFALIHTMRSSDIDIQTIGLGTVASAATFVFIEGTIGRRILTEDVKFITHKPLMDVSGEINTTDILDLFADLSNSEDELAALYKKQQQEQSID